MKLLILPQVYPPEAHPTAVMYHQLAAAMVRRGHDVTVACGYPHHPTGQVIGGYSKRILMRETTAGVRVLRGWHVTTARRDIPSRAAVMVSQAFATAVASRFAPPPQVVLNVGPPLVGPLAAALVARRFGAKLVTVIYDIYPDVAVSTGQVRSRLLISAASAAEQLAYSASDSIVVLSDGFRETLIGRGVRPDKIEVVPVWLTRDEITPGSRDTRFRRELGIALDRFVVLYAGTVGLVSGAEIVPLAADLVRDPRVLFVFVGSGEALEAVKARAHGSSNVRFAPRQPRERLAEVQASGDVGLVTLAPGFGRTSVPSKVVGYLAAGRPVLASVDAGSDTARCVADSGGVVVPPGDPAALAQAVDALAARDLAPTGLQARAAFLRGFTEEVAVEAYARLLDRLARAR